MILTVRAVIVLPRTVGSDCTIPPIPTDQGLTEEWATGCAARTGHAGFLVGDGRCLRCYRQPSLARNSNHVVFDGNPQVINLNVRKRRYNAKLALVFEDIDGRFPTRRVDC
jgi:hypothetical protein